MPPTRLRHPNVTAAQWSANGGALGAVDLTAPANQIYGANVFSSAEQRQRLPKDVYKRLQHTLENGEPLDVALADAVAAAMKDWALEKGATHYTHWFQPLTGLTAEKHDSFYAPTGEGARELAERLRRFERELPPQVTPVYPRPAPDGAAPQSGPS